MFFDKPWNSVTSEDISELATRLKSEMGGWVFHSKVNFSQPTPHLNIEKSQPELMNE